MAYNEHKDAMGSKYYAGYSTSSEDVSDGEDQVKEQEKEKGRQNMLNDESISKEVRQELQKQQNFEDSIKPKYYIISTRSTNKFWWDALIILFACINAFSLPLEIAFEDSIATVPGKDELTVLTTVIFLLDVVVGFFTSYINVSSGDEIFSLSLIAKNYLVKGTFPSDFISSI